MLRRQTLLWLLALAPVASRAADPLDVQLPRDGAAVLVLGGASVALAVFAGPLTPNACRFCEPNALDRSARSALRWPDVGSASRASDLLANGILPGAVIAHAAIAAWGDGGAAQLGEDLLSVTEAVLLSTDLNLIAKSAAGRIRPSAWAAGQTTGTDSNRSFYSGHTALAFSLASAAGTVATIRGYRSAPWVWAVGMTLATGVAYLRVAADAHWLTDVLAGAAVGGAAGFGVPWTLHRRRGGREPAVQLTPAPGGFALRW